MSDNIELIGCSSCGGGSTYSPEDKERIQQQLQERYNLMKDSASTGNNALMWIIIAIVALLIIGALLMRRSNAPRRR